MKQEVNHAAVHCACMARSAKPGDHDKMAGLEQQLFLCNTGFACIPRCKPIRTVHAVAVLLAALLCPCPVACADDSAPERVPRDQPRGRPVRRETHSAGGQD